MIVGKKADSKQKQKIKNSCQNAKGQEQSKKAWNCRTYRIKPQSKGDYLRCNSVNFCFDDNYKGTITNIRVYDKEGDIVEIDDRVYERTSDKALYVAFKHEFTEV